MTRLFYILIFSCLMTTNAHTQRIRLTPEGIGDLKMFCTVDWQKWETEDIKDKLLYHDNNPYGYTYKRLKPGYSIDDFPSKVEITLSIGIKDSLIKEISIRLLEKIDREKLKSFLIERLGNYSSMFESEIDNNLTGVTYC